MKKFIAFTVLFWCCCYASAQIFTGVVCEKDTKEPIPYVYVYFDGTSINTLTDTLGKFKLETKSVINAKLVLQHLSYQTSIIERPFEGLPDTLYLEEKLFLLGEVTVQADRFSRKQKMKAFREQFLGVTNAGRSCTIFNEDDVYLTYNATTRRLIAFADVPVIVINNYLGYKVIYTLMDFYAEYKYADMNYNDLQKTFFSVTSSFIDLNPYSAKIMQRRKEAYKNSTHFFFKCFVNNSLAENGFEIFNKGFGFNPEKYFAIIDASSQKKVTILPGTDINKEQMLFGEGPSAIISVFNRFTGKSTIHFLTNSFLVDRYGYVDCMDKIVFTGQLGESRAGDMLPREYEP